MHKKHHILARRFCEKRWWQLLYTVYLERLETLLLRHETKTVLYALMEVGEEEIGRVGSSECKLFQRRMPKRTVGLASRQQRDDSTKRLRRIFRNRLGERPTDESLYQW